MADEGIAFALLKQEVGHLRGAVDELKRDLHSRDQELKEMMQKLVTQTEFWPIKQTVYGIVGGAMLAVIGALLGQVMKQ